MTGLWDITVVWYPLLVPVVWYLLWYLLYDTCCMVPVIGTCLWYLLLIPVVSTCCWYLLYGTCCWYLFMVPVVGICCKVSVVWYLLIHSDTIYINNCPTKCDTKQSIYYSASSLYMFLVSTTPIIRSTQNCNYSLRYCSYLPPTWQASLPRCRCRRSLPAFQDSCEHFKCWKPYAVVYSLALLKRGTMVAETCWVIGLSVNHNCCIKLV